MECEPVRRRCITASLFMAGLWVVGTPGGRCLTADEMFVATTEAAGEPLGACVMIAPDASWNGLFTFLKPERFRGTAAGTR